MEGCNSKLLECQNVRMTGCETSWKSWRALDSGTRDELILAWAACVQLDLLLHKTVIPLNYLCDLIFPVTHCWRLQEELNEISHVIHEVSFSVNLDLVKCTCTLLVTNNLQYINLPCSVFQCYPKSGNQIDRSCNST